MEIKEYRETVFLMLPNGMKIPDNEILESWGAGEYKAEKILNVYDIEKADLFIPYLTFKTLEKAYVIKRFMEKKCGLYKSGILNIIVGYCSYSRQERETENEPALLPDILEAADLLLGGFKVIDGHNNKSFADHNIKNMTALIYLHDRSMTILDFNMANSIIVAPDKGAASRNTLYGIPTTLTLEKHRSNGKVETKFPEHFALPSNSIKTFVILDDICDGGRTFANAAELIKERYPDSKVILVVTHAILPYGVDLLKEKGIDKIITSNTCLPQGEHFDGFVESIDIRDKAALWTRI